MNQVTHPIVLFYVRFKSNLPPDELERRYKDRMPEFRALPGLIQKYYIRDPKTGECGGLYLWDSQESLDAYLASDLRKTIPETYEIAAPPHVEAVNVIDVLRA